MSDDGLDELRRDLLAERGIDPAATSKLIGGTTVDEVEARVDAFTKMVNSGGTRDTHEERPSGDLFTDAARAKTARRAALIRALAGRPEQPRDVSGRWTAAPSFDGGARASVPAPRDPAREHDELIVGLASASRVYRGPNF